jgi:hypothetical protein
MPGELFGTIAAPLVFVVPIGVAVLLTIVVRRLLYEPTRPEGSPDVQPARPEGSADAWPGVDEESRRPKII